MGYGCNQILHRKTKKKQKRSLRMTIKKIWKRICCLFHDDRTRLREGERIEDWEEVQRKRREIKAEKQSEEDEILSTWFVREEFKKAGWFKKILLYLEYMFRDIMKIWLWDTIQIQTLKLPWVMY